MPQCWDELLNPKERSNLIRRLRWAWGSDLTLEEVVDEMACCLRCAGTPGRLVVNGASLPCPLCDASGVLAGVTMQFVVTMARRLELPEERECQGYMPSEAEIRLATARIRLGQHDHRRHGTMPPERPLQILGQCCHDSHLFLARRFRFLVRLAVCRAVRLADPAGPAAAGVPGGFGLRLRRRLSVGLPLRHGRSTLPRGRPGGVVLVFIDAVVILVFVVFFFRLHCHGNVDALLRRRRAGCLHPTFIITFF